METQKLNPEFKAKFLAALRSGEYKQGKHTMYDASTDSLCCLAVAGVVCGIPKEEFKGIQILNLEYDAYAGEQEAAVKAIAVGYPEILVRKSIGSIAVMLAQKNDEGQSFTQIADWIDANL